MTNYHYDEAGNMAAYFLITFLAVILTPLTLSLSPTSKKHVIESCQCQPCINQRLQVRTRDSGTFLNPKLSKKTLFVAAGWGLLILLCFKVARSKIENKIYDPFEILGLRSGVTEKEIKAHFKKLSRTFHPDKVKLSHNETAESVANRFVDITKAYKSLTDEAIRKNWELYGHPDGRQEVSMGIALPHWIIEGKNNIWVLGFYALVFGVTLPFMVGRWWFGNRQKTKDGVNALAAAAFFKSLKEESGMDDVVGTLGKAFEWEWPYPKTTVSTQIDEIESRIEQMLGRRWGEVRRLASSKDSNRDSNRRALILLYAHFLRITISNSSLHKEQTQLLLLIPQLLSALLTVSTSRSWLAPTLSVMRLHAYLAQALAPGDEKLKFAQLPGIQTEEVRDFGDATVMEEIVLALNAKGDSRISNVKKAVQTWGRIELVDASFKVIGERLVTPSSIVFLIVKLRLSPPSDSSSMELTTKECDLADGKRIAKVNEDKDAEFLSSRKDAEDLLEDAACGWAHAPYWPGNRKLGWWLVLADDKTNRVVVPPMKITDVPFSKPTADRNYRSYKLQFQAPPSPGLFTWKVYLVSDTLIGEDVASDITLKIDEMSTVDDEQADDEISEPDEDSLAGQMALMKGGAVKRVGDEESDESCTDEESHGSSSDSDSD